MGKKSRLKKEKLQAKKTDKQQKQLPRPEQSQKNLLQNPRRNDSPSQGAKVSASAILQMLRRDWLHPDPNPKKKEITNDAVFLEASRQIKEMQHASHEELVQAIQRYGVNYQEEEFIKEINQFDSVYGLLVYWKQKYSLPERPVIKEAMICETIYLLMKRLMPNIVNADKIDEMMQDGYVFLEQGDYIKACTLWLEVWEILKKRFTPDMKSIEDAERVFDGSQSLFNWCQDLGADLGNAGLDAPEFFEKQIQYCQEFCVLFPKTHLLIVCNMKRAVAEAYFALGMQEKGEAAFQKLAEEFPSSAWVYIGWGDMYCEPLHENIPSNYDRAEELYKKALKIAGEEDKSNVLARLDRLEQERRRGD